jgi:predicted P-loop ATPase
MTLTFAKTNKKTKSNDSGTEQLGKIIHFSSISTSDQNSPDQMTYIKDYKGQLVNNVANAVIKIKELPALKAKFRKNLMANSIIITGQLGKSKQGPKQKYPRTMSNPDITNVQIQLQHNGLDKITRETVLHAIEHEALDNAFHPLREELESFVWDLTPRLKDFCHKYLGTTQDAYFEFVGRAFLISAVARVFDPGCKVDHMIVFEGKQGIGKSTACKILGGKYFSDALPDLSKGKEVSQHLAGMWILEVQELAASSKAESAELKAFITRSEEKYRRPYDALEVNEPRQCVFIGTTNKSTYLRDETGARRFWPVKVVDVPIEALTADRDQLLAEAVACYKKGEKWHPDKAFEKKYIFPQQDARYEDDAWEVPIRDYLKSQKIKSIYVGDILSHALLVEKQKHNRADQNRVTAILQRMGWVRLKKDAKGNLPWGPDLSNQ